MDPKLAFMCSWIAFGALVPPAAADCIPVTADPEIDTDRDAPGVVDRLAPLGLTQEGARYYVANDACQLDMCVASVWVYEESNDRPGLQRKDGYVGDQTCGLYPPDRLLA